MRKTTKPVDAWRCFLQLLDLSSLRRSFAWEQPPKIYIMHVVQATRDETGSKLSNAALALHGTPTS